jgi:hypothetical protein
VAAAAAVAAWLVAWEERAAAGVGYAGAEWAEGNCREIQPHKTTLVPIATLNCGKTWACWGSLTSRTFWVVASLLLAVGGGGALAEEGHAASPRMGAPAAWGLVGAGRAGPFAGVGAVGEVGVSEKAPAAGAAAGV